MSSDTKAEWRENWGLVFAATIGIAIAGIHFHVVGALVKPLNDAYGWSRSEVTLALTISSLLSPFTNIAIGWLADQFGPRLVMLYGVPLFGISFAMLGLTGATLMAWYIGYGLFAVLGHGNSPIVWTMAVVRKFNASRGLALAVSLSGAGLLVAMIPGIVYGLIGSIGVPATFFMLGAAAILLVLPPAYLFLPKASRQTQAALPGASARTNTLPGLSVTHVLTRFRFWRLAIAFLIISVSVGTFIVHTQSMLTDAGMTRQNAAQVALFLGPAMIFGRICTGLMFDRFDPQIVAGIAFLLPAVACLMLVGLTDSTLYGAITALVIGLGMGAEVDVLAFLTSRYFGLRRYGIIFGLLIGLYGIGVGLGSTIGGLVYDRTGSYDGLLLILAGLVGLATVNVTLLGKAPAFQSNLQTATPEQPT